MREEMEREWPVAAVDERLLAAMEGRLREGLVAVRPLSWRQVAAWLVAGWMCGVVMGAVRLGVRAPEVMNGWQAVMLGVAVLVWVVGVGAAAVGEVLPGVRRRVGRGAVVAGVVVALAAALAAAFPGGAQEGFLAKAWGCFRAGVPYAVLAGVLGWMVLRRGYAADAVWAGGLGGAWAGLAGAAALSLHCPNLNAWHMALGHFGVPLAGGLAGALAALIEQRLRQGRRSSSH